MKINRLGVALLQLMPTGSVLGNTEKGVEYCKKAKEMGADIVLFPEMWSSGYNIPGDTQLLNKIAIGPKSQYIEVFSELSKELNMAIAVTYLEGHDPMPKNTVLVIDRFGKQVLKYSKVHTCDFGDECRISAGDGFYVADLDTECGNVKIGAMICYDREFPESARILMLKGAEIVLVPNACPMEINRISQLRARAYENMFGIATCNYPLGHPDCNGHSTAFDGIVYPIDGSGSRDTMILDAGEGEGIFIADFPIDDMRAYREREVHGNSYRRPEKYSDLLCKEIKYPFIRNDRRK